MGSQETEVCKVQAGVVTKVWIRTSALASCVASSSSPAFLPHHLHLQGRDSGWATLAHGRCSGMAPCVWACAVAQSWVIPVAPY